MPTFGSDIEEWHSSNDQEDPYFEFLVDNFISASGDVEMFANLCYQQRTLYIKREVINNNLMDMQ